MPQQTRMTKTVYSIEEIKELISFARAQGVLKLCYNGLELVIDPVVADNPQTPARMSDDDLAFYSAN